MGAACAKAGCPVVAGAWREQRVEPGLATGREGSRLWLSSCQEERLGGLGTWSGEPSRGRMPETPGKRMRPFTPERLGRERVGGRAGWHPGFCQGVR